MQLLSTIYSREEEQRLRTLLEENGIPLVILGESRYSCRGSVWTYLNSQYKDAIALLNNPEHVVSNPIDVIEFYNHIELMKQDSSLLLQYALKILGIVAILFTVAVFIIFK